jgi:transcription initiation factor TFIIB
MDKEKKSKPATIIPSKVKEPREPREVKEKSKRKIVSKVRDNDIFIDEEPVMKSENISKTTTFQQQIKNVSRIINDIYASETSDFKDEMSEFKSELDEIENTLTELDTATENTITKLKVNDDEGDEILVDGCIYCGSTNIQNDTERGCFVCADCGTVVSTYFDRNPERGGEDGVPDSRCGTITNSIIQDTTLCTKIAGNAFLSRANRRNGSSNREQSLLTDFREFDQIGFKHKIKKPIINTAQILYAKITDSKNLPENENGHAKVTRGDRRRALKGACIYFASKKEGDPRTPKEIAHMYNLKVKDITQGCTEFMTILEKSKDNFLIDEMQNNDPIQYLRRHSKKLKIPFESVERMAVVCHNVVKLNLLSDHQPPSVTAGVIALLSEYDNNPINKKIIANTFNISEVTLTNTYRKLVDYLGYLIDDEICQEVLDKLAKKNLRIQNVDLPKKPMHMTEYRERFNIKENDDSESIVVSDISSIELTTDMDSENPYSNKAFEKRNLVERVKPVEVIMAPTKRRGRRKKDASETNNSVTIMDIIEEEQSPTNVVTVAEKIKEKENTLNDAAKQSIMDKIRKLKEGKKQT